MKRKILKKNSKKEKIKSLIFGVFGFFVGAFLIGVSSRGPGEKFNFDFIGIVEFLGIQISYFFDLPRTFSLFLGAILLTIPGIFFYFLRKEIGKFNFKSFKK